MNGLFLLAGAGVIVTIALANLRSTHQAYLDSLDTED